MASPRRDVPAAFLGVDSAAYADNAGFPGCSALGVRVARNDRWLYAHLRRDPGRAWPKGVTVSSLAGTDVPLGWMHISPGSQACNVRLCYRAPTGDKLFARAYVLGDGVTQPPSMTNQGATTWTGAAGLHYVNVPLPVTAGWARVGVIVWSQVEGSTSTASVLQVDPTGRWVRGASGDFTGLGPVPIYALRLLDAGTGDPLTDYAQILTVQSSGVGGAVDDVAVLWPQWEPSAVGYGFGSYDYEQIAVSSITLLSATIDEGVPTDLTGVA